MKTKIALWCMLFFVTTVIAVESSQPQVIHLDDGTTLTLLGIYYDINNTPVVWIRTEHDPKKWPNYQLVVSDRANTGCVNIETTGENETHVKEGVDIQRFHLNAFPRWDKETILRIKPYGEAISKENFVMTNLAPASFPEWSPKPLPDTESDGDLEVTLTKLVAGAPTPSWRGGVLVPTNDPAKQCVHLNFDFRVNGQSTTNWNPWPVQTTDASGNWSRGLIYAYPTNGVRKIWGQMMDGRNIPRPEHYGMDGYYYQPGLWPNQPWKVRLEFIQRSGFSDDEIVTFTNLPVKTGSQQDWDDEWSAWDNGKTNFPFTITPATANGVHLKLLPPLLVPDKNSPGQKRVSVIIGADPDFNPKGMNLTVVSATDDQGRDLWHPFGSSWAGHYDLDFPNIREIKSLNLKLALHKSRLVEFTVKPSKQ